MPLEDLDVIAGLAHEALGKLYKPGHRMDIGLVKENVSTVLEGLGEDYRPIDVMMAMEKSRRVRREGKAYVLQTVYVRTDKGWKAVPEQD